MNCNVYSNGGGTKSPFYGSKITKLVIREGVEFIGNGAFAGCKTLTSVQFPSTLTTIENNAFDGCSGITTIILPQNLQQIGNRAFAGCSVASYSLPNSVTSVGYEAFQGYDEPVYNSSLFAYMPQDYSGDYTIPEGITTIGCAFYNCTGITSVTMPSTVYAISDNIFYGCSNIEQIHHLPDNLKSIPNYAFYNCKNLQRISIPSSVTSIGSHSFENCERLTEIELPQNLEGLYAYSFAHCKGIQEINIPSSVTSIGQRAFYNCTGLSDVRINEGVKSIDEYAFCGCTNLTELILPHSITSILRDAFNGCMFETFTIPQSVTILGKGVFENCSKLKTLIIEDGNSIIDSPHDKTYSIKNFPGNLENVYLGRPMNYPSSDYYLYFENISSIKNVTVGPDMASLDKSYFWNCKGIQTVTCLSETPPMGDGSITHSATLYVPKSSLDIYMTDDVWGQFSRILPIMKQVSINDADEKYSDKEIGNYDELTYTRTFNNTNWQAIYVPFAMNFDDWAEDFDLAEINNFHEYDDDLDGTIDRTELEILYVTSGDILPNTPYLIRAKETGEKTITLTDATLYKTEVNSVDCSSVKTKYTFTGTYNGVSGEEMYNNGYYALAGGALKQAASSSASLGAFRWYLKAEPRGGSSAKPRESEINIRLAGDDDATGIANAGVKTSEAEYFTLSGAKVASINTPGIYVVKNSDGTTKKVIKK